MEKGTIMKINNGIMAIEITKMEECGKCPGNKICSSLNSQSNILEVRQKNFSLKSGDIVNIEFKPKLRIISAIIVFFVPLIVLIACYYLGFAFFKTENLSMLVSFSGFIIYFIIIFFFLRSRQSLMDFNPIITKADE